MRTYKYFSLRQRIDLRVVYAYNVFRKNYKAILTALFYISFFTFVLWKVSNV